MAPTSLTRFFMQARRRFQRWCKDVGGWLIEEECLTPPASTGHLRRRLAAFHAAVQQPQGRIHREHPGH